jgi:hypothetical protein
MLRLTGGNGWALPPTLRSASTTDTRRATHLFQSSVALDTTVDSSRDAIPTSASPYQDSETKNNNEIGSQATSMPQLGTIGRMLPRESFDIDTKTSLFYFGVDFAAVTASLSFLYAVVSSEVYHASPWFGQAALAAPLQILAGFTMWCMWCIGYVVLCALCVMVMMVVCVC